MHNNRIYELVVSINHVAQFYNYYKCVKLKRIQLTLLPSWALKKTHVNLIEVYWKTPQQGGALFFNLKKKWHILYKITHILHFQKGEKIFFFVSQMKGDLNCAYSVYATYTIHIPSCFQLQLLIEKKAWKYFFPHHFITGGFSPPPPQCFGFFPPSLITNLISAMIWSCVLCRCWKTHTDIDWRPRSSSSCHGTAVICRQCALWSFRGEKTKVYLRLERFCWINRYISI